MNVSRTLLAALLAFALLITACGDADSDESVAAPETPTSPGGSDTGGGTDGVEPAPTATPSAGGWIGEADPDWSGPGDGELARTSGAAEMDLSGDDGAMEEDGGSMTEPVGTPMPSATPPADLADREDKPAEFEPESDPVPGVEAPVPPDDEELPPEPEGDLTAGSVDDNANWTDYLLYLDDAERAGFDYSAIDVSGRHVLTVLDQNDQPVLNANVELLDDSGAVVSSARTMADGRALLYVPAGDSDQQQAVPQWQVAVTYDKTELVLDLDTGSLEHTYKLEVDGAVPAQLDVLFLIDATGSMADEIQRLKANMVSVAEQIDALPGETDVRFAMTVYRDREDLFVTRTFDFTSDVLVFTEALQDVVADGGGDYPEDLNRALHDALAEPDWRTDDTVRLVFLVADAPPQLNYGDYDYADEVQVARDMGVKITPIASSGTDDQAEFVFRQLAQNTLARFLFLTYGADGASPGTSTELNVDDFAVLALDELVVQVITEELLALNSL